MSYVWSKCPAWAGRPELAAPSLLCLTPVQHIKKNPYLCKLDCSYHYYAILYDGISSHSSEFVLGYFPVDICLHILGRTVLEASRRYCAG